MSDIRLTPYLHVSSNRLGVFFVGILWLQNPWIFPIDFSYWNGYSLGRTKSMISMHLLRLPTNSTNEDAHAPGRSVFRGWQPLSEGVSRGALLGPWLGPSWLMMSSNHFMIWITRSWTIHVGDKRYKSGYHRWWLVDDCTIVIHCTFF